MTHITNRSYAGDDRLFSRRGYDFLLNSILTGKLPPGEEINRRSVAEELGVSLAPINEAVGQLVMEGFLEVSPRRQTRVKLIRKEEVRGLLILREAIECQAARLYCGQPVVDLFQELSALAAAVDQSQPATQENEYAEMEFHSALIKLVGVPLLLEEFHKIMRRRLFHKINALVPMSSQPPLDCHVDLLNELRTNDPDAAESVMRRHLQRGRERMMAP